MTNSVWLSAVISVIMAVVTALGTRTMLQWMNTPAEIIDDAVSYIQLIFAAIPVTVLYNLSGGILRALGDSKTPCTTWCWLPSSTLCWTWRASCTCTWAWPGRPLPRWFPSWWPGWAA